MSGKFLDEWKVGAYEPTVMIHGDIKHAYLIDLEKKKWSEISINKAEQLVKNNARKLLDL